MSYLQVLFQQPLLSRQIQQEQWLQAVYSPYVWRLQAGGIWDKAGGLNPDLYPDFCHKAFAPIFEALAERVFRNERRAHC